MAKRMSPPKTGPEASLYQRIGPEKVERLVAAFYARVDRDPVIRPFYGKTLSCAIHALTKFMTTWLGGSAVYDVRGARLCRRHLPFPIDARARDAWLADMKAAMRDVGIPPPEARILLAHLEFGANALVNTGRTRQKEHRARGTDPFDARLAERWNRMSEAEELFDAVSCGDVALLQSMLPLRRVPHARLMRHALAGWLDPTGAANRRLDRRRRQAGPLEVIEALLAHCDLDGELDPEDSLARFLHLEGMMETYARASLVIGPESPLHAALRAATRDRFVSEIKRDPSCVRLLGLRGQTLLHDAAMFGQAELAAALIRCGADPDATENESHTPLYRASGGDVARVLLDAGATVDVVSGPTRGTPLHQAARRGCVSVAQALLDHGAATDARDAKGQTPLRRAVNCRKMDLVRLLVRYGADPRAPDRRGVTPLATARTVEMKKALTGTEGPRHRGDNSNSSRSSGAGELTRTKLHFIQKRLHKGRRTASRDGAHNNG